jgi:hypothetical protein
VINAIDEVTRWLHRLPEHRSMHAEFDGRQMVVVLDDREFAVEGIGVTLDDALFDAIDKLPHEVRR